MGNMESNLYMFECKKKVLDKQLKELSKERRNIMSKITRLKKQLRRAA